MVEHQSTRWGALALLAVLPALASGGEAPAPMAHMDDDPWQAMVLLDRLEWQNASGGRASAWDLEAWAGRDGGRLLFRAEGEREDGDTEENRLELLWWRPITSRWNLVAGLRQELEPETPRTYAGVGLTGLAPGWVEVTATAWYGERGQVAATLEADLDLKFTNRLILQPDLELDAYGRDDEVNGLGSGLATVAAGLRLRYEIRRELAPYVGLEWAGRLGDTADLARADGESVRDARWVAGVRAWF
jgi:copper resistance protein B